MDDELLHLDYLPKKKKKNSTMAASSFCMLCNKDYPEANGFLSQISDLNHGHHDCGSIELSLQ